MPLSKGEKTKYVREAIVALGGNDYEQVTKKAAEEWLKNKYGPESSTLADSTYYNIRRAMLQNRLTPVAAAQAPSIASLVPQPERAHHPVVPTQDNGIVALVKQLKQIVTKLGRSETKELIDVL